MNYYSTTKGSRKYTLHITCIANFHGDSLRVVTHSAQHKFEKLDVLYALVFSGLQEVLKVVN